jgi:hypothetical protein
MNTNLQMAVSGVAQSLIESQLPALVGCLTVKVELTRGGWHYHVKRQASNFIVTIFINGASDAIAMNDRIHGIVKHLKDGALNEQTCTESSAMPSPSMALNVPMSVLFAARSESEAINSYLISRGL